MLSRYGLWATAVLVLVLLWHVPAGAGALLSSPTRGLGLPIVNEWLEERTSRRLVDDSGEEESPPDRGFLDYGVSRGDTLWSIARHHGLNVSTLAQLNGINNPNYIRVGDRLVVPPVDGVVHRLGPDETLVDVSRQYGIGLSQLVEINQNLTLPAGASTDELVFVPGARPLSLGGDGHGAMPRMLWPVRGRITSSFGARWGRLHTGIDIAAPHGTTVRASERGRVVSVGWLGSYGRTVVIDHGSALSTLYGHLSTVHVRHGQQVHRGEVIGQVGNTGNSTGPHLHFEVRKHSIPRDPLPFLGGTD